VELQPCWRFAWERIIRRCTDLDTHEYAVALTLATFADPDGTHIFPGTERLIRVTKAKRSKVLASLARLRSLGLVERVSEGRDKDSRYPFDEYRLTTPSDIFSRLSLLNPDDDDGTLEVHLMDLTTG